MNDKYDSSWDLRESDDGYLLENKDLFEAKFNEWEKRNWLEWLGKILSFPFMVERMEDDDDAYFTNIAKKEPFRLGHKMEVTGLEPEEGDYGILVKVKDGKKAGSVPLADLEVVSREDKNFWPVKEYVVWFANR